MVLSKLSVIIFVLNNGSKKMNVDVLIIGAGAAGLMCGIEAAKRKRSVLILDHSNKPGKKILLSGGGRCNFTNLNTSPNNYLSQNPNFCISALKRYTPYHFLDLVNYYKTPYHEKTFGQLFCDHSSKDILDILLTECKKYRAEIRLQCHIESIKKQQQFHISTNLGHFNAASLVIATGGLSFPTMGASPFGYRVAEQFGLNVLPVRAGLVPLTLQEKDLQNFSDLSGVSVLVNAKAKKMSFKENLLFTHRGLSGPSILQISSYWQSPDPLTIDWLPEIDWDSFVLEKKQLRPKAELKTILAEILTQRVANRFADLNDFPNKPLNQLSDKQLKQIGEFLKNWPIKPNGTEGYRTAEVTLGGIDTDELSSKTMMSKKHEGLFFIGEVVDVTGQLGGYNFQWAWASGHCAGQFA